MNSRTAIIAAVALVLSGIVFGLAFLQRSGQRKIAERQKELERDLGNLTQPMTTSILKSGIFADLERFMQINPASVITF